MGSLRLCETPGIKRHGIGSRVVGVDQDAQTIRNAVEAIGWDDDAAKAPLWLRNMDDSHAPTPLPRSHGVGRGCEGCMPRLLGLRPLLGLSRHLCSLFGFRFYKGIMTSGLHNGLRAQIGQTDSDMIGIVLGLEKARGHDFLDIRRGRKIILGRHGAERYVRLVELPPRHAGSRTVILGR